MNRLFGWKDIPDHILNIMTTVDKAMIIYPHTSGWDMVTMIAYICSEKRLHHKIWPVIRKAPKNSWKETYLSFIFPRYMNMLAAPTIKEQKQQKSGFIDMAVNKLKNVDKYYILMSPEGETHKQKRWKSGYYILAKKLKIPIIVLGIDFSEHKIKMPMIINPCWKHTRNSKYMNIEIIEHNYRNNKQYEREIKCKIKNSQEKIEELAMNGMSHIMPLFLERSLVKPQKYLNSPTLVPSHIKVIFIILIIIFIILVILFIRWIFSKSKPKPKPKTKSQDSKVKVVIMK